MKFLRRLFDFILEPQGEDKNLGLFRLFVVALAIITTAFAVFVGVQGISLIFGDAPFDKLGQTGDFFGGVLNPLLTFLTFIGVLATIFLQREELKSTREEIGRQADALETQLDAIAKQNFEATLFQLLNLQSNIVDKINVSRFRSVASSDMMRLIQQSTERVSVRYDGRDAIEIITDELHQDINSRISGYKIPEEKLEILKGTYAEFWKNSRQQLGHYFRFFYNTVRFIDESKFCSDANYTRFVRAQLSDYELLLLFYNCLSNTGGNFKDFAEKYSLLNNIPPDFEIDQDFIQQFDAKAFHRPPAP